MIGITSPKNRKVGSFLGNSVSCFFDRNEIHIQDFAEIPPGKLMSGDFSSSTFHPFQEFIIFIIKKSGILIFKNSKIGHPEISKFSKINSQITIDNILSRMLPYFS